MIVVNLLPYHLRPIKRTPVPYLLSVGAGLVALGACASLFFGALGQQLKLDSEMSAANAELDSLKAVVEEFNQLSEKKLALADKVSVIQEILSDRKIWSEHLNRLAELTPKNIWYSRIRVTSTTDRETVPKVNPRTGEVMIDPKTKEPQTEVRTVKKPVLEINGYVINDEQGRANIYQLSENTANDAEFSEHFRLFRPQMEDTDFNGFMVRSFKLEYLIETGTGGTA